MRNLDFNVLYKSNVFEQLIVLEKWKKINLPEFHERIFRTYLTRDLGLKLKSSFKENRNFVRESYIDESSGVTIDHYYSHVRSYNVSDGWIGHSFSMTGSDEKLDILTSNIIKFFKILEKNKKLNLYL